MRNTPLTIVYQCSYYTSINYVFFIVGLDFIECIVHSKIDREKKQTERVKMANNAKVTTRSSVQRSLSALVLHNFKKRLRVVLLTARLNEDTGLKALSHHPPRSPAPNPKPKMLGKIYALINK